MRWVHEGCVLNLLPDVLVLVEGEGAGEAHLRVNETSLVRKGRKRGIQFFVVFHIWHLPDSK